MSDSQKKYLFTLADDSKRPVYLNRDTGIMQIDSNFAKDDYKKEYNRFVDDYRHARSMLSYIRDKYHEIQANLYRKNVSIFHRILSRYLPYVPYIHSYGNFLDIGCNTGSLLSKLPSHWIKYGVEISAEAYKAALVNKNIKVYNTSLENFDTETKFAFVRASHVIEHVIHYDAFLQKIHSIMEKDGYALLYTPNTKSISCLLFRKYWNPFYEKTHVHIFNLNALAKICRKHNFEVVEKGTYYMGTTAGSIVSFLGLEPESRLGQIIFFTFFILFYPFSPIVNALKLGGALYLYIKKQ